jgi:hypothetical protein
VAVNRDRHGAIWPARGQESWDFDRPGRDPGGDTFENLGVAMEGGKPSSQVVIPLLCDVFRSRLNQAMCISELGQVDKPALRSSSLHLGY